jgi:hypothetical protein
MTVTLPDTTAWTYSVSLAGRMPPGGILVFIESISPLGQTLIVTYGCGWVRRSGAKQSSLSDRVTWS